MGISKTHSGSMKDMFRMPSRKALVFSLAFLVALVPSASFADTIPDARVEIEPLPRTASFLEGTTFQIPIFINTHGLSINSVELDLSFDPSKMRVINPSGGKSIIGVWVEPPFQDNRKGVVRIVGVIPNGITTDSGLIATLTFQAITAGTANLVFEKTSSVLLNDGLGTKVGTDYVRGTYTLLPRPSGERFLTLDIRCPM